MLRGIMGCDERPRLADPPKFGDYRPIIYFYAIGYVIDFISSRFILFNNLFWDTKRITKTCLHPHVHTHTHTFRYIIVLNLTVLIDNLCIV